MTGQDWPNGLYRLGGSVYRYVEVALCTARSRLPLGRERCQFVVLGVKNTQFIATYHSHQVDPLAGSNERTSPALG